MGRLRFVSARIISMFICFNFLFLFTACGELKVNIPTTTRTPPMPTETALPTVQSITTPTISCQDVLVFNSDLTIPDNSIVSPGASLDKQWQVQNQGTCNWDDRYRLRLISGDALGASPEQALYPARVGTQATIRIVFTAPMDAGNYVSEWQAYDANGIPFGDSFFIKITVQP